MFVSTRELDVYNVSSVTCVVCGGARGEVRGARGAGGAQPPRISGRAAGGCGTSTLRVRHRRTVSRAPTALPVTRNRARALSALSTKHHGRPAATPAARPLPLHAPLTPPPVAPLTLPAPPGPRAPAQVSPAVVMLELVSWSSAARPVRPGGAAQVVAGARALIVALSEPLGAPTAVPSTVNNPIPVTTKEPSASC